jgi:glycosyltransferase EpsD
VGVDIKRFRPAQADEKRALREEADFRAGDFIVLYTAEFISRKNHIFLLRQVPVLRQSIPELRILFAGKGELLEPCKKSAGELGVAEIVHFLGYRNDVEIFCRLADIHVSPSRQEGLAVSNLEAMASGLPLVCSKIRGATDIVTEWRNGLFFDPGDPDGMTNLIIGLYKNPELREAMTRNNIADARKFSVDTAVEKMADVYRQFM